MDPAGPRPGFGFGASPTPPADLGSALTAYVLIFSPGDHPFYKFGHNAIWIHDVSGRNAFARDRVYNWGTFSFGDPALIPKFFLGRFMYWLSAAPIGWTKEAYRAENRGIVAQELDLTSEQKVELQRRLEENLRPENRYYKYDYYRDNCSTRVRDMVDLITGGRVKAVSKAPARMSYRDHTLRLTADLAPEEVILNLVMGDFIDKPITVWEEAFIPMELQKTLRAVTVPGPDGTEHPLVKREFILVPTDRPDPAATPPVWWPYALVTGLLAGLVLAGLGRAARTQRFARVLFGTSLAFFGLVFGFLGTFFIAAWVFTDHVVGYRNENIFLCAPWVIVLTGTGVRVALNRVRSIVFAEKLVRAAAAFALLGTVLKVLPWFDQKNGFFILFFVPFWVGAAFGLRALKEHAEAAEKAAVGKKADVDATAGPAKKKQKKKKAATTSEAAKAAPPDRDAEGGDAREAADDEEKNGVAEKKVVADAAAPPAKDDASAETTPSEE